MSVSIQKIEGVESVKVSLNEGQARIVLKPGNRVTLEQLRELIKRNGFTPRQASVSAEADVISYEGRMHVRIAGTNEMFAVASSTDARVLSAFRKPPVTAALVDATISLPDGTRAEARVTAVKPSTRGRK